MDMLEASRLSGIHHKTLEQFIRQVERENPWFDWQQSFDWEQEGPEIRDIGGSGERLAELKRRVFSSLKTEKERGVEIKKRGEEELEYLAGSKPGVKSLLRQIYKDPSLSKKKREQLKEAVIAGAPELATLIALYDGEEQDYAKRFLREMVLSPTAEIRELLAGDTLKIKSSRGWIREINDVPLVKPVRSIDVVEKLAGYSLIASQPDKDFSVAVYKKKEPAGAVMPVPVLVPSKPVSVPSTPVSEVSDVEIEPLLTQYSYKELKEIAKQKNIFVSGSKSKILSRLIEYDIL